MTFNYETKLCLSNHINYFISTKYNNLNIHHPQIFNIVVKKYTYTYSTIQYKDAYKHPVLYRKTHLNSNH